MELTTELIQKTSLFPDKKLQQLILQHCRLQIFSKGEIVVREGQFVKVLPLVISGIIRVFHTKDEREILLYYVEPYQTCLMSLSACFFNSESPSQAVAVEETICLIVPSHFIAEWQKEFPCWNNFVLNTFRSRYDELLNTFESITFEHIDKRLLEYLQLRASRNQSTTVEMSHQQIANELGTTRVVISRILKQFEGDGIIKLYRRIIELT